MEKTEIIDTQQQSTFKSICFLITVVLNGFSIQVFPIRTEMGPPYLIWPVWIVLYLVAAFFNGVPLPHIFGYKPMLLAGFFFLAIWSVLANMYVGSGNISFATLAGIFERRGVVFAGCLFPITRYQYRSRKRAFSTLITIGSVVFGYCIALSLPKVWRQSAYQTYAFAMIPWIYFAVPDTSILLFYEEHSLRRQGFHLAGFVFLMVLEFIWIEYVEFIEPFPLAILFTFGFLLLGGACSAMAVLGDPRCWKETASRWKQKRNEWKGFYDAALNDRADPREV